MKFNNSEKIVLWLFDYTIKVFKCGNLYNFFRKRKILLFEESQKITYIPKFFPLIKKESRIAL